MRELDAVMLHEAFEAQVARTPEALAVVGEDARLTYRELAARANRLAVHLRSLGVGPEVRVGVCLERTAGMVVALLATLEAGGAYVPLDPAYPRERLGFMLRDAGAGALITRSDLADRCGPFAGITVDPTDWTDPTDRSDLPPIADSGNLAYLIYTSGSTGRPKGVAIEHRSAVALLRWAADTFSPDDLSGVLAATSICFDLSVFEIFVPLALGGTVIVASNVLDLPGLGPPISLINTVPSAMAELVRSRRVPASVRVVNLAGEPLPGSLVEEIYRTTSVERVYNLYGPSEDTTYSTEALISRDDRKIAPPIGDPLPGTRAWLLDREGTPVPFGKVGELYLSGEGLARGYLGRPELTADRFLPDPFSGDPGARMYRTGDLARLLSDGQLYYLGRADQQVKIRGFRVELGEVEDALARHPAVREAAVAAHGEVAGGTFLVAYLVTDGPLPETGELRSFLGRTLPHYMIPSQFLRIGALPRTLNGKLDRKALAAGPAPLSFAQQRIWLAELERPGQPTYNEPAAWDFAGPLDRAALAAALSALVARHAVLRTRTVEAGNAPFQEVDDPQPIEVPLVDLAALPASVRDAELERGLRDEVRRLFALAATPLLRATLFRCGDGGHSLSLVVHHIAYDGRSKEILVRELAALYVTARAGRPAQLPALSLQYGDFARRQREAWQGVPPARLAEWRQRLAGAVPLELPADRPRPAEPTSRGTTVHFELPPSLASALRDLARAEGASLFQALLAVFAALLGRWGDRRDGVLGTTTAGRGRPETRDLIGFFVNLLPLRLDLAGRPGLRALLARVRPVVRAAAEAQEDLPYEQLVAALREGRDGALFRVLFQLHPPLAVPALEGLAVRHRPVDTGTAKFDLEGTLLESGGGLLGYFQASADLYEPATVARLAERFGALLAAAVAGPEVPLEDVPLFSAAEMEQLAARRLAAARRDQGEGTEPAVGPAEVSRLLVPIWAEVLGLDRVGPRDNFFHLGGHSLLGGRVLARIRELFGVDLPLRTLFRAPTAEGLAAAVADALRGGGGQTLPPVERAPRGGRLPQSFAQERFRFLEEIGDGSAVYNVPSALRLDGRLAPEALAAALREIVRRHEALRTRLIGAFQEIAPAGGPELVRIDLSGLPEEARQAELARGMRAAAGEPFDLTRTPLLRSTLIRLGADAHVLVLCAHHAAFDGWSQRVLHEELSALYAAAVEGRPSPLPELPVQVADFAVWQRRFLSEEALDGLLDWWSREIEGAPQILELPSDRPRPQVRTFRGTVARTGVPAPLAEAAAELGRREGATRFMVLCAVFQVLIGRLAGEDDLLLGSPVSNRPRPELEGLIGLFVDVLVLRGRLAGDPPLRELLGRVRESALRAFAHQGLPFDRLVSGLRVERSPARNPLIQVMFSLQEALSEGLSLPGIAHCPLDLDAATAKNDLSLIVEESGGALSAIVEVAADLFERVTARRLLERFLAVLAGAVRDPAQRLSDLPLLSPAENHQLLVEWNDTDLAVPAAPGLVQRIAERARRAPDALAIVQGERRLTYSALDLAAGRLARRLRRLGVGPESRVAVCLPRSIESVVSLLAVWKAGGAYVPLDPAHPVDRLAAVLEDSAARLLIARDLALPGVQVLDPGAGDREEPLAETIPAAPNALAYVIYTSGSTGRPKGVEIGHDSLLNLVDWYASFFRVTEADRKSLLARVGFDASAWEVWPTLSAGASLWVPDEEVIAQPEALRSWMVEQGITLSFAPTPLAELLLAQAWTGAPALRVLQAAGDRLRQRPPADLPFALMNLYGPTEATICSTAQGPVPSHGTGLPTIGRPIGNGRAHVLDAAWQPVPAGVPGELCIGGAGVGRGYLGAPALTALSYIPDPFAACQGMPGLRLYRTGDLVRLRLDGEIEFLGRVDRQVKLRGFRVELGEIEAALARHPAIREAAVVLGGERLVAFATPKRELLPPAGDLAAFLRRSLPDYMVPSLFATLEVMPLSANGKLDRRALAETIGTLSEGGGAGETLRTPVEELIAQIWCEVLRVAAFGPDDDFFQLGGHSLAATGVISRVRDLFAIELPVRDLFQAPTVRGLARRVAAQLGGDPVPALIRAAAPANLLPVSFAQQALWFIDRLEQETAVYNVPVAWRLRGPVAVAALEAGLGAVARRHAVLRARFVEVEGEPFQTIAPAGPVPLPRVDLSALPPESRAAELARIGAAEAGRRFDLGREPLLRALLIGLAPHDHVLALMLHHMVWDGWSTGILSRELAALYGAALAGSPSPLPALPLQYADYAAWQRGWLEGTVLKRLLAWWRLALEGAPQVLQLPTDRPRPPVQTYRGAWEHFDVPAEVTGGILALGRREGATAFMTLLAAFQTLLHRLADQDDLLVGSPAANRPRRELEALIGYFVETVVLRSRFQGEETFARLLGRVRDTCLGVMAHQELPFEKLVAELQVERDLSRNPLFQVMLSFEAPVPPLALPGVTTEPLSPALPVSKFELSLTSSPPEVGGGFRLTLEYNLDLFDPSTARSFLERFAALLAAVAADPARRLDALPLVASAEAGALFAAAAATAGLPPAPRRLHDLFAEQAARTPHALAVQAASGERLTYADLDRRSRALACFLCRRGVGAEVPVGVCLDRSPELIIALLGVLRAGGVYLPLDPAYPAERLSFMLEDAGAPLVLTRETVAAESCADAEGGEPFADAALPGSLAYLIYTSGSGGRPKGVGVPHAVAAAHLETIAGLFALETGDRILQFSSPSFDMSLEELLPPLFRGAAVVLRESDLWQPAALLGHLAELGVTVLNLPTAYWHQWAVDLAPAAPSAASSLRLVILGGEAMSGEAARAWLRSPLAGLRLLNSYGPTEGVVTSTVVEVDAILAASAAVVPIGRAIAGRSAWVLDRFGHPVPAGVPGELCLGGPMLARGYLGRRELTAERFVPDPFSAVPGSRLYRTGDRVCRRADGILEFLGRLDRQLKIRGFRVEPGEIEAALAQHPAVRETVIEARADAGGDPRLVAWVVPAAELEVPDLQRFLRHRLPDHMVPSAFVLLEALPLTPNGKVDRRALAAPQAPAAEEAVEERPRTPVEERLAGLWQELLGQSRIALSDSFFALGGHSLLALRLLARVRELFGVEVRVHALFTAPTLEGLAETVESALSRRHGAAPAPPRIVPVPRQGLLPASFIQRGFWLIDRLQQAGAAFNIPTALRLCGLLDRNALAAGFAALAGRHEVLRTRLVAWEGEPWQEIAPPAAPDLPLIDLRALPAQRREAELHRLLGEEVDLPLDLSRAPLLRLRLLRLAEAEHALFVSQHHAVSDAWSEEVFLRELAALYAAETEGRPALLPGLPVQYADFAGWQRRRLTGEPLAEQIAFWREQLAGVRALELPYDRPRPAAWSFRGAAAAAALPRELEEALRGLCRDAGATPFMALLAVAQVLLGRMAGQTDFAVGSPVAGRHRAELEPLLGPFINLLALRSDLAGMPSFRELLARVRERALAVFAYQDLPFELLVEALAPEREAGRHPLVQAVFQLLIETAPPSFPGLTASWLRCASRSAKLDLALQVTQSGEGLEVMCEYSRDLFERTTVERLLGRFALLLAGALETPERAVDELEVLAPAERHQLIEEWNDTDVALAPEAGVHRLVAEQARRRPDALAITGGGAALTYGELNRRAERLARRLRRLGAGPDALVGVCLERSPEQVTALLAVLAAGAAYLPLDPSLPRERLDFLLADSGAAVVIGRRDLAADVEEGEAGEEDLSLAPPPLDGSLAYVIYTSGSTGRPKGVEIDHRSLLHLVAWQRRAFALAAGDHTTLLAQVGFDASVWEIWPALAAGASLHQPDEATRNTPERLRDWFVEEAIAVGILPTPLAEAVLALPWPPATALRALLSGGDRLRQTPDPSVPFVLYNNYGPTEVTVVSTYGAVPPRQGEGAVPSIGRPIDNLRVHVLDGALRPVPIGVPGELYVGGAALARGYRRRPDLTAERFLPDPLPGASGERLYRTGDLARLLPDGEIDFLGRNDDQVKIRGFRIELGEVEAVLLEHPAVRAGVVVVREEPSGARLVAYVVREGDPADPSDLRAFLASRLPAYMVPSAFVAVDALPVTSTGKVDRRALAQRPVEGGDGGFVPPSTPLEEALAAIWEAVLGRERVGRDDDFFALGGHSLLVAPILSRIREALGVDLPMRVLFTAPTVAALASCVEEALPAVLPPIRPVPRGGLLPLAFPQQRLWFIERLAPDSSTYNIPSAFQLTGRLDPAALAGSLGALVRRHEVLRTRYVEEDGQPRQEVLPAAPFVLPEVDLSGLPEDLRAAERARLGREEAARPFDLAAGPLRSCLLRLAAAEHVFCVTVHHIASDGWSEDVLRRELSVLYAAALAGEAPLLPALPVQYADFAVWQRAWPPELLDEQLDYWTRRLAGLATLEVPTDRPRPPLQSFRGGIASLRVPPAVADALRALAGAQRVTLFMLLIAAWQTLFHRLTGQSDVAVGTPVANRNRPEVEGLIGFFVNMLALRTDFSGAPSFAGLLEQVRRTALEAYDHADVPFERLVDELGLERDLSRQPLVQVMFMLQQAGSETLRLPGLAVEPLDFAHAVAKFDLTLSLADAGREGFLGWLEYSSDLFDRPTVLRLLGHLENVLAAVACRPGDPAAAIRLLTPAERHQVLEEWNDTAAPFPERMLVHQGFEMWADRSPLAVAAVWRGLSITYGALEARANRIAALLCELGAGRGKPVGVWMERSPDMIAAVLGVLKAGGHYLPLDPSWPAERVETILAASAVPAVLTRSAHLEPLLELRWRVPSLADVICLDVEAPAPPAEAVDAEAVRAVFDLVAERAVDRATAGGFISSFTGEPFSAAEVDEYRDRVLALAGPWLRPDSRVLEIGSGSGLILWEVAPRVARCVGLDPSPLTQERNRAEAERRGLGHVELPVGFAHVIGSWPEDSFDLVLLASTVQFFPGPLYLEKIVSEALRLLAPGGALVLADVPDARRRAELERAIGEHRAQRGLPPLQDSHQILHLDEDLFRDLDAGATVLHRDSGFDNELGFRYDVVLTREAEERSRRKRLWTSWHVERAAADRLPAVASPEDLAYVIHTSGSTGQPKGIMVQHRPVANLFHWINSALAVGPADRVLFVTSLCFDLSVWDVFGLLAAGGSIHVAAEEELRDPEALVRALLAEGITIWDSAPAALVRLAPLFPPEPAAGSRLRRVMLSGDWIPVTLPDRVRSAFPGAEVTSLGGATEATVWSNVYPVGAVDPAWPSIPYGRPMPNAQYRVLDAGLYPCPAGVPGDLSIGGDCLCVGYAHEPALTAAAFVPDPFAAVPGARLYRTGDRARAFADGTLEFLGRVDQQVKIRGFRIELGEIEVALARHPGVREAVVLAREDVPGDRRLVAYVVPPPDEGKPEEAPEPSALRDFLRRSLPDYMLPAAFVALDQLPVTANGKLDRRALPAPTWEGAEEDADAAPRTPTEEILAALWRELLGVERVGLHDSFFDLGGHSLLATQLLARLRETLALEVPLRVLFQAPALADFAAALDAELAVRSTAPIAASPVIPVVPRDGELPLSASQLRQWFLVQLDPASAAYNLPVTLGLDGDLQPEVLAEVLCEMVRRHESLRTTFGAAGGRPYACVAPGALLPLPLVDLGALPAAARRDATRRLVGEDLARSFDLTRGPLLRATLLRLAGREHVLAVSIHHIVFDGFSLGIFLRELATLYEAFAAGRPSPLPPLPIQYVDYAAWQQGFMATPELAGRVARWKERLAGASRVLELPADRPRPAVQSHRGSMLEVRVPPTLAAALKALTGREGVTLFMAVLAGYATLLSRSTGQDDLNVGTFVANRRHEVLERLIGFFVNTLVLRTELTGDPTFHELLVRTRDMTLEAFDLQDIPFEQLLDELEVERDPSRTPLFQVMFGLQNFAMPTLHLPGLTLQSLNLADTDRTPSDLAFWMWEEAGVLNAWLQRSTDLFDAASVERMGARLTTLLAAAAADPGARLSELRLLPEAEERQILAWSAGLRPSNLPALVHERMHEQARRTPDAPAVVAGGQILTYAELDRRAGRVARGLLRLGVGPETVVGLCMDRTPELIVALYGILGAGAAYLPLDPKLPADRLVLLTGDSGAPAVVTRRGLAASLPALPARVLLADADFAAESGDGLPERTAEPESAAYVLYTSGSTGAPKGVVVEHRALAAFVAAALEVYGTGPRDRVLQFASPAFDTSAEEIYPCLAVGGTLVLRDEEMLASPARFFAAVRDAGITVLDLPTAWWHELSAWVEGGAPPLPDELRLIILGGERALPERVRGWLAAAGTSHLVNSYGPTEGTVVATACDLGETAPAVPIGQPLSGVEVWLLDAHLRPVPTGVAGAICLGGADLARGYLGRPDLTAERFVPSPFGPTGARLYLTGDLGRWRPDGQLDFAGRVDDQVKIRGFRIEPGEVAAALARHPAIQEAVVLAHEVRPGERELTAYAVPFRQPWPDPAELRAFLKESLPVYMLPAGILLLEALPRTRTGKVDRRALRAPDRAARHDRRDFAPPETATEELIAGVWQQLLGVERAGIYDNFFDLGGHSLLAPQVISRIEEVFQVELPLRILFAAPTVAQMAVALEEILLAQIEELSEEEAAGLVGGDCAPDA